MLSSIVIYFDVRHDIWIIDV